MILPDSEVLTMASVNQPLVSMTPTLAIGRLLADKVRFSGQELPIHLHQDGSQRIGKSVASDISWLLLSTNWTHSRTPLQKSCLTLLSHRYPTLLPISTQPNGELLCFLEQLWLLFDRAHSTRAIQQTNIY